SALHSISPFGGGTRVGPGSANGNRIISVNWEPNRSSGEEIPQQIVPFGGVKVDPGSANGKQISPLGGGIKVDPGSDNGHQVVSILDGIRVGSDDANGDHSTGVISPAYKYRPCNSCGEEIPQMAVFGGHPGTEIAGGEHLTGGINHVFSLDGAGARPSGDEIPM